MQQEQSESSRTSTSITRLRAPTYDPHSFPPGIYRDSVYKQLVLKVTSNSRTWHFNGSIANVRIKRRIGDAALIGLNEARVRALEMGRKLEQGVMPPTESQRLSNFSKQLVTVAQAFDFYVDNKLRVNGCRTLDEIVRSYNQCWKPIADIPVARLTARDVAAWMKTLTEENGKGTANKQLNSLKATLNFCHGMDLIDFDVKKLSCVPKNKEHPRLQ